MSANRCFKPFNLALLVALILIFGAGYIANLVQTGNGSIKIRDVRFMGSDGKMMSALLYIPKGVNKENKAPGVVAMHGYINSRETQDSFAIEFARRGYVVLAADQTGHGYSDPPAFANGYGGVDALNYIRTLDFVDTDNIALEGHSMGGWASAIAAAYVPNGYKSFIMASSSTGTYGAPEGTATYPKNLALIFSQYDEFSGLMWGAPIPKDIVNTKKLKTLFNTTESVVPNKLYGSIEEGTARKLYQPAMIHPKVHFSTEATGYAIDWLEATLKGGKQIDTSDQTWYWKEFFTLLALIGMVVLLLGSGKCLLTSDYFEALNEEPAEQKSLSGFGWWFNALVLAILPVILYVVAWASIDTQKGIGKATFFWPQQITNTLMFWAMGVGLISLCLFLLWHFFINKKKSADFSNYGLSWVNTGLQWGKIWKSFVLAFVIILIAHLSLNLSDALFKTDFRFWVFGIKPLDTLHFGITLGYLIPFTFYFLVLGLIIHGQMRPGKNGNSTGIVKETLINVLLMTVGLIFALLAHYMPLFSGGTLLIPDLNLPGIVLIQFVPMFTIVGIVMTYFYRKTGHIYTGAFICAMFVVWQIVAGQATHYPY